MANNRRCQKIMLAQQPSGRCSSSFARISLLICLLLIIYTSGYPFTGWRNLGLSPFVYLLSPLPHYWSWPDVWANIIGYIPFGILLVLSLPRHYRFYTALVLGTLSGIVVSVCMEAIQIFLPLRVVSNLDLLTNSSGAFIGAMVGVLLRPLIFGSHFLHLRQRWFKHEASHGMVVIALWPLAQLYPFNYVFGFGQLTPFLSGGLPRLLQHTNWLNIQFNVNYHALNETIITACGLSGAALTFLILLRRQAPKLFLTALLILVTLSSKTLANTWLLSSSQAFLWLTPGVGAGLLLGSLLVISLAYTTPTTQRRIAGLMLIIVMLLVNFIPDNPYYTDALVKLHQGKFMSLSSAARFLGLLWPFCTVWFLFHRLHRQTR